MTPLAGQRKVRVNLGEQFDEVGLAENNKWIEMVVEGLDVYLVSLLFCYFLFILRNILQSNDDGTLHPVDSSTAIQPSIDNTWFIALVKYLFIKLTSKKEEDTKPYVVDESESDDTSSIGTSGGTGSEANIPQENHGKSDALTTRSLPVEKSGGGRRRRKVNKRR